MRALIFFIASAVPCVAQHTPDLDAQRSAMKKLEFMVGKWAFFVDQITRSS